MTFNTKCDFLKFFQGTDFLGADDTLLSYLPMAHMMDRISQVLKNKSFDFFLHIFLHQIQLFIVLHLMINFKLVGKKYNNA